MVQATSADGRAGCDHPGSVLTDEMVENGCRGMYGKHQKAKTEAGGHSIT